MAWHGMGWDGFGGELHLNAMKYLHGFGVFHSTELEKEDLQNLCDGTSVRYTFLMMMLLNAWNVMRVLCVRMDGCI